jgi:tetratricopeptide (TPR) repeat protein
MVRGRLGTDADILASIEVSITEARASGDSHLLIRAMQMKAEAAADVGSWGDVRSVGIEAQSIAQDESGSLLAARANMTAGFCAFAVGDWRSAYYALSRSAAILIHHPMDSDLSRVLNGIGICFSWTGRPAEALRHWADALLVARSLNDVPMTARILGNRGSCLTNYGYYDAAQRAFEDAGQAIEAVGSVRDFVSLALGLADLLIVKGDLDAAGDRVDRATSSGIKSGLSRDSIEPILWRADFHLAIGDQDSAMQFMEDGLTRLGGRLDLAQDPGRTERLRLYRCWVRGEPGGAHPYYPRLHLQDELEILAAHEWIRRASGLPPADKGSPIAMLKTVGLTGIVDHLKAVGMLLT